jgi:creatinine amidohydrolase
MKKVITIGCVILASVIFFSQKASAEESPLPAKWEELTAPNFVKAVTQSGKVCIIPLGIIEKHGPHMPLGTDLIDVRAQVLNAVKEEYAVVFPEYYVGQINEARHQPGVVAYSPELIWKMLQETCNEISRNGFEKIIFVNGHGGNNDLVKYFCMSQLSEKRNYAIYLFQPKTDPNEHKKVEELMRKMPPSTGEHAGAIETSYMLAVRPDLVKLDMASAQSGEDLDRLADLPDVYTGIWWYAKFPNHYAGDGKFATAELGKALLEEDTKQLVRMIREVKADTKVPELQKRFFEATTHPIDTKQ